MAAKEPCAETAIQNHFKGLIHKTDVCNCDNCYLQMKNLHKIQEAIRYLSISLFQECQTRRSKSLCHWPIPTKAQGLCPSRALTQRQTAIAKEFCCRGISTELGKHRASRLSLPPREHNTCSDNWHPRHEREGQMAKALIDGIAAIKEEESEQTLHSEEWNETKWRKKRLSPAGISETSENCEDLSVFIHILLKTDNAIDTPDVSLLYTS
ncbi:hypothetical protein Anapl_02452 [Anas platyrhynchos]|uniref:Uncharacterized protein n=1 Tax=Anas platyrhynchos TaxID=8839 RepID=R0LT83_ANAPL|nr:hypothetical protein Anapl_02452 [Anas platyrhynchos]